MFRSAFYRSYKTEENISGNNGSRTQICKIEEEEKYFYLERKDKTDLDGIVPPGTSI